MKAGNRFGGWRPVLGVVMVGALTYAVGAQGGPRVTDDASARSNNKKADNGRLVTGDTGHLNSVVAGSGANMIVQWRPSPEGGTASNYPAGTTVGTSVLEAPAGGFAAVFNLWLSNWDPNGDQSPKLRTWQAKIDAQGYMGSNASPSNPGCDLAYPFVTACANNAACTAAYESGSACGSGTCAWAFQSTSRADWLLRAQALEEPPCPTTPVVNQTSPTGPVFAATTDPGCEAVDGQGTPAQPGDRYYAGTQYLGVPACAKGTYTMNFLLGIDTFFSDEQNPSQDIPVAQYIPGQIKITTGSCCTNLGPGSTCTDNTTAAECAALPTSNNRVFRPNVTCATACPSCTVNGPDPVNCGDGDACTQDICTNNLCSNPPIASWNQATQCCNSANGTVTTLGCSDQCETAACSAPGNHGTAQCNPRTGQPCDDDNTCTATDTCAGGAGSCAGTQIPDCVLNPEVTFELDPSTKEDPSCYDEGKITGTVHIGNMTGTVNGGQIRITYDPTCLEYNSIVGVAPFTNTVFGPVVDESAGTIFVAVSIDFGGSGSSGGNFELLAFSFDKIGDCNSCNLCFGSVNPQNSYLVDQFGQRIILDDAEPCSADIRANNAVTVNVPGNIKTNVDCNTPTAVETWSAPSVTDTCGTATLTCRGEHESGLQYTHAQAMGGAEFPVGVTNFCCYAVSDYCDKVGGCPPDSDCDLGSDGRPVGCWTVDVNDETSLDIEIGLGPNSDGTKVTDGLTRCIKFTLYGQAIDQPVYVEEDITFGGMWEYVGKFTGAFKVPMGNWQCISAWDQFHTLRSCYRPLGSDCIGGVLHASFTGDPSFDGGNWLIGGNLDGWKKNDGDDDTNPSLFVIDILDWGTLLSQYGQSMDPNTPCGTDGPHADINGDGVVNLEDVAYVQNNFLVSAKECCGAASLPASVQGRTEVSVSELRQMGMGNLQVADLNGDGLLNVDDMSAFMQGVRPGTKSTKGTRTGSGTR